MTKKQLKKKRKKKFKPYSYYEEYDENCPNCQGRGILRCDKGTMIIACPCGKEPE